MRTASLLVLAILYVGVGVLIFREYARRRAEVRAIFARIRARGTVRARLVGGTWFVNGDDYERATGLVLGTVEERPDGCSCGERIGSGTVDGSVLDPCSCSEHPA